MLDISDINTFYDESHVLRDLSMEINEGEVVVVLGRNGAGKTTTLRSIMGLVPPRTGAITFKGERIDGLVPEKIFNKGIGLVPEDRGIFPDLTVEENLRVGLGKGDTENLQQVYESFPRLEERLSQDGETLSGGEQQMLSIARVLVSNPEIIMLDEPSEGLMPTLVDEVQDIIRELNEEGITIVLVEQNSNMALEVADRAYIIDKGTIVHSAPAEELREDREVLEEHMGV
jgi:branched-chain amino acid transport system ATP-binding protein